MTAAIHGSGRGGKPLLVSVVTAVRNRVGTIAHAIRSVQAQVHPHVEHIIQDGVSDDGTLAAIADLATPATRLVSEPDAGPYDAMNRGIARASGEVIGLMHSDDFFPHEGVLSLVADAFADPAVDAVYGDLDYVAADDPARIIRRWRSGAYRPAKLRWGWMPPHPTLYVRRRIFERHGLYDPGLRIAADYDMMLRCLSAGGIHIAYVPQVLVKMRVGGASNASLAHVLRKSREDYAVIRRNGVGGAMTLLAKNLRKLPQFLPAGRQEGDMS